MQFEIVQVPAGPLETNAFIFIDPALSQALIIDAPPESSAKIEAELMARKVSPTMLVITHGHWDHVVDAAAIRDRYQVPVLIHELDRAMIESPGDRDYPAVTPDRILTGAEQITLGEHVFEVIHTPGHAPGQVSLYSADDAILFGGDTLFPNGYGRVDIAGASEADTLASLARLLELPDNVTVYPGHGAPTTIGQERSWMERVVASGQLF